VKAKKIIIHPKQQGAALLITALGLLVIGLMVSLNTRELMNVEYKLTNMNRTDIREFYKLEEVLEDNLISRRNISHADLLVEIIELIESQENENQILHDDYSPQGVTVSEVYPNAVSYRRFLGLRSDDGESINDIAASDDITTLKAYFLMDAKSSVGAIVTDSFEDGNWIGAWHMQAIYGMDLNGIE